MQSLPQRLQQVSVGDLTPHPRNPRHGDVGAIHQSITTNGWYGALIVQKSTGHVLAGNHRLQAAVHAGARKVPALVVDCDDETALRILLADNRTSDLASNDDAGLAAILQELAAAAGLEGTGYDTDDLDDLLRDATTTFLPDTEPPARLDQRDPHRCPECGFEWRVGPGNTVEPV